MSNDRERAEQALREVGFKRDPLRYDRWERLASDGSYDAVDLGTVTSGVGLLVPTADLPALLAPRLTDDEREALL